MKALLSILLFISVSVSFAQMGDIWPVTNRQEFEVNDDFEITKTYDQTSVCQFFMFLNNNEFIHVTDDITSLYKIIKREYSKENEPIYTVVSEAGNTYMYLFKKEAKQVFIYSTKGYAISFACITPYTTEVFKNLNK